MKIFLAVLAVSIILLGACKSAQVPSSVTKPMPDPTSISGRTPDDLITTTPVISSREPTTNPKIIFEKNTPETCGIYMVDVDGSNLIKLNGDRLANVLPDGKKIAYQLRTPTAGGGGQIGLDEYLREVQKRQLLGPPGAWYIGVATPGFSPGGIAIMSADGTGQTQLTETGWDPIVSPDGNKIAYTFYDGLYVINADGTGNIKLVDEDWVFARWGPPVWAPDSKRIIYAAATESMPSSMTDRVIYVINADGSGKFELEEARADFSWSPDGKQIVYTTSGGLYIAEANGTGKIKIANDGSAPSWSPDGRQIAYRTGPTSTTGSIYIVNADGTGSIELATDALGPRWSPDGTQIFYASLAAAVYVVNSDGTGKREFVEKGWLPIWSPDGKKGAYEYGGDLYVINTEGTGQIKLTNGQAFGEHEFVWSPDSQYIALTGNQSHCLYVADVNTGKLTLLTSESSLQSTGIGHIRWLPPSK